MSSRLDRGANGRPAHERMFMTDLAGSIYAAHLDGSERTVLLFWQGNLTGIAFAELP